jgi:hypothetical protein
MGYEKMFLTISFTSAFYNENKSLIEKYLEKKLGEGNAFEIRFDELPDEVLYQFQSEPETFLDVLNHFFFNSSINAIGSLVIPVHYHYFLQMREYGYLEKIVKKNYRSFFKEEMMGNVYIVLDLSQYRNFEKLLLLITYFDNSWDESDNNNNNENEEEEEDDDDIEIEEKKVDEDKDLTKLPSSNEDEED